MLTMIISHEWKDWCRFSLTVNLVVPLSLLLFVIQYRYILKGQKLGLSLMCLNKSSYHKVKRWALRKCLCIYFCIYLHLSNPTITTLANSSLSLIEITYIFNPLSAVCPMHPSHFHSESFPKIHLAIPDDSLFVCEAFPECPQCAISWIYKGKSWSPSSKFWETDHCAAEIMQFCCAREREQTKHL